MYPPEGPTSRCFSDLDTEPPHFFQFRECPAYPGTRLSAITATAGTRDPWFGQSLGQGHTEVDYTRDRVYDCGWNHATTCGTQDKDNFTVF
jgi:hypothetical protein